MNNPPRIGPGRIIFTVAILMLILLQLIWHGWWQPNLAFAMLLTLPLLIPLPWLMRGSLRAAASLFFITLIHFLHGVTEAVVAIGPHPLALLETGLCLILYASMILWTAASRSNA